MLPSYHMSECSAINCSREPTAPTGIKLGQASHWSYSRVWCSPKPYPYPLLNLHFGLYPKP